MARGRMLSRDISLDEKVNALPDDTSRLLFTWLIPHLDVEGRMYGEAQVFKSIVAPRRPYSVKKIEKYLKEMEKLGLIFRYSVNGNQYLYAPNFKKHQTGLRKDRESQSKIPPYSPEKGRSKDGVRTEKVPPKIKFKIKSKDNNNNINLILDFIKDNFPRPITKHIRSKITEFNSTYPEGWVLRALQKAVELGKPTIGYTEAILKDWKVRGVDAPPPERKYKGNREPTRKTGEARSKELAEAWGDTEPEPLNGFVVNGISGQSIETAIAIVNGEVEGVPENRREYFRQELEKLGIGIPAKAETN